MCVTRRARSLASLPQWLALPGLAVARGGPRGLPSRCRRRLGRWPRCGAPATHRPSRLPAGAGGWCWAWGGDGCQPPGGWGERWCASATAQVGQGRVVAVGGVGSLSRLGSSWGTTHFFWGAARVTTGSPQPHQGTVSSGHMAGALRASGVPAIATTKEGQARGGSPLGDTSPARRNRQVTQEPQKRRLGAVPHGHRQAKANHTGAPQWYAARRQRRAQARRRTGSHGHQHPPGHGDHSGGTGKTHQRPPLSDRAHRHDKTGPHRSFREHAGTRRKGPFVTATEEKEGGVLPGTPRTVRAWGELVVCVWVVGAGCGGVCAGIGVGGGVSGVALWCRVYGRVVGRVFCSWSVVRGVIAV